MNSTTMVAAVSLHPDSLSAVYDLWSASNANALAVHCPATAFQAASNPCCQTTRLYTGIGNTLGALRTLGQAVQQLGSFSRQYSVPYPEGCTEAVRAAAGSDEAAGAAAEELQTLLDAADAQQREGNPLLKSGSPVLLITGSEGDVDMPLGSSTTRDCQQMEDPYVELSRHTAASFVPPSLQQHGRHFLAPSFNI